MNRGRSGRPPGAPGNGDPDIDAMHAHDTALHGHVGDRTLIRLFNAGLCSLGMPGFSGFVAETTVFMGAWERTETAYRVATIGDCASIVVTAVYILRATGQVAMGPLIPVAPWLEKGESERGFVVAGPRPQA